MKKKIISTIIIVALLLVSSFAFATEGAPIPEEWRRTTVETEKNDRVINNSHVMAEENSSLENVTVDGNLVGFATTLNLTDVTITGDVFVFAETVNFTNVNVTGTVFMAGDKIIINSSDISGNLFVASATTMQFSGNVQDMFAASGSEMKFNENTVIGRELFAACENIDFISGDIYRNAHIAADNLKIGANVSIAGDLNHTAENEAEISSDAIIGKYNLEKVEAEEVEEETDSTAGIGLYSTIVSVVKAFFICGFIAIFAKGFIEKQKTKNIAGELTKNVFKGLAWLVLIPLVTIILLLTGVAFGLSFVVILLYSIILWAGVAVVSTSIAANINVKTEKAGVRFGYTMLVALIISIIKQLPVVGGLITFLIGVASLGIVFSSLKNKKTEIVEPIVNE